MKYSIVLLMLAANCASGQVPYAISDNCDCIPIQQTNFEKPVVRGTPVNLLENSSLDGWTNANGKPPGKGWTVSDGILHRGKKRGGDLYHEHWYRDFELQLEFKISAGGNSGIKYRVKDYGKRKLGCEFQIQDDKKSHFHKHSTGSLYDVYEPNNNKKPIKPTEWNSVKIIVNEQNIEHWLNGDLVVKAKCGSSDWLQRVSKSKFKNEDYFGQNREGGIFLQDHGSEVWFRNIVVIPIRGDDYLN